MLDITKSCSAPNFNVGHYLQPVQPQTLMLDITCNCSAQTFVPATNTGTIQLYHLTLLPVTLTWLRVTWPIKGKTYMCHFLAHFWTDLDEISCGVDVEHPYTMFCEILLMKENKLFSADWIFEKRLKKKKKMHLHVFRQGCILKAQDHKQKQSKTKPTTKHTDVHFLVICL